MPPSYGRKRMRPKQSGYKMADDVLDRQARAMLKRSECSPRDAMGAVLRTAAGRGLRELRDGPLAREKTRDWRENLLWDRALERLEEMVGSDAAATWRFSVQRRHPWLEGYLERLEGTEARIGYYALLDEDPLAAGKVRSR